MGFSCKASTSTSRKKKLILFGINCQHGKFSDSLVGGDDADTFIVTDNFGNDTIVGGEGVTTGTNSDTIDLGAVTTPLTVTFAGDKSGTITDGTSTITFSEIETIILPDTDDLVDITGDSTGVEIWAGGGADTVTGGSGGDTIFGFDGADSITGGDGNDSLDGDAGADILSGGAGNDTLIGDAGADVFVGGTGADDMYGGLDGDTFTLAEGDSAFGQGGDDTFILTDLAEAGASTITIVGGETDETAGDTLDFNGLVTRWADINITNSDDSAGGLSGTATLADGTVVNFSEIETLVVCFTAETRIETKDGLKPAGEIKPGDMVMTLDHGAQEVRWVGTKTVLGRGNVAPIHFAANAFGNDAPISVSPQHRMLICHPMAEMLYGAPEVFVPAASMINGTTITQPETGMVTYVHILLDHHEVIYAEGAETESFLPAKQAICALDQVAYDSLLEERPDLALELSNYGQAARPCLTMTEARALIELIISDGAESSAA